MVLALSLDASVPSMALQGTFGLTLLGLESLPLSVVGNLLWILLAKGFAQPALSGLEKGMHDALDVV